MSSLERYFEPKPAFAILLVLAALQYAMLILFIFGGAPDYVVGGDFVAFWSAGGDQSPDQFSKSTNLCPQAPEYLLRSLFREGSTRRTG